MCEADKRIIPYPFYKEFTAGTATAFWGAHAPPRVVIDALVDDTFLLPFNSAAILFLKLL